MLGQEFGRICLGVLLLTAVAWDLRFRRIPNLLVIVGLLAGFAFHVAPPLLSHAELATIATQALPQSLLGMITGLACLFPLYLLRAMGAGDVKLMAAVGAFLGPNATLSAVLVTFVAGGVLSVLAALFTGTLRRVLDNVKLIGLVAVTPGKSGIRVSDIATTGRMPYAVAIAVGTMIEVWLAQWPYGI